MAKFIPSADRKPHIFLSHSSRDKDIVKKLASDLLACEVDVWLDEWEIEVGDNIFKTVNEGLENSKYVAVVITANFMKSTWALEEVQGAFSRQLKGNEKVILPLIFEDVEIPLLLKDKLYLSFLENNYQSLVKLAGVVHDIELRTIVQGIENKRPTNLEETLDTLYYCGFNPHRIIPKNVFDELSQMPGVEVNEYRLRFPDLIKVLQNKNLSEISKSHLNKIWQGDRFQD